MRTREQLDAVIKAYDVRGVVGEDIDENFVRDTGAAFAAILREEGENTVAVATICVPPHRLWRAPSLRV